MNSIDRGPEAFLKDSERVFGKPDKLIALALFDKHCDHFDINEVRGDNAEDARSLHGLRYRDHNFCFLEMNSVENIYF